MSTIAKSVLGWLAWLLIDKRATVDVMKETPRFGAQEWKEHFGLTVEEPEIPSSIQDLLKQSCPFWPEKHISETHLLCLIPKDLTLQKIYDMAQCHLHSSVAEIVTQKNQETHWILITKKIIPATADQSFKNVEKIVSEHSYRVPFLREAVIAVIAAKSLKIELFPTQLQFTTCQEVYNGTHPLVGYDTFAPCSIYVNNMGDFAGTAGVRLLKNTHVL